MNMTKKYPFLSARELIHILGTTIKHDNDNKLIAFIGQLSVYTEDSQLNVSFNAPSSTGKSFIPIEIAKLFPPENVMELGQVSPTAFYHMAGEFDKEKQQYTVDLSNKIIIFLDQPHTMLIERMRPILSHDKKEIESQITDKTQKHGLRTKKVIIRGFPAVTYCSAGLRMDEQEITRFLLLSPEITQDKIKDGVLESLKKSADRDAYLDHTELNTPRQQLKKRILAIRDAKVADIRITIEDQEYIKNRFLGSISMLKPRHQRDIKRLVSISKIFALLNLWERKKEGSNIVADRVDIDEAFTVWERISISQELNIPPYVYRIYEDVIIAAFNDKNDSNCQDYVDLIGPIGVTRQEIMNKHYKVYGRMIDAISLRQQILPMLVQTGLIIEEQDPNDKRSRLVSPVIPNNSELGGGVKNEDEEILATVNELFKN
jgi:aspartate carbamoyltransferase regulatory subunit